MDNHKLLLTTDNMKTLVYWSLFIEEGDIHAGQGKTSITEMEREFAIRLLAIYKKLQKLEMTTKHRGNYYASYDDCEICLSWYHRLPENLLDDADADLHQILSIFICES